MSGKPQKTWKTISSEYKTCLWCKKTISRMGQDSYRIDNRSWERRKCCGFICAARHRGQQRRQKLEAFERDTKPCGHCKSVISRKRDDKILGDKLWAKKCFCSRACAISNRMATSRANDSIKIQSFIEKKGKNDCWLWKGYKDKNGYGRTFFQGVKSVQSHRAIYILHNGKIPKGQIVMHSCDNPPCNNPKHLSTGTHQDNANDRESRNRRKPIPRDCRKQTKFFTKDLLRLQEEYRKLPRSPRGKAMSGTVAHLAAEFNLTVQSVLRYTSEIRIGESYAHRQERKKKEVKRLQSKNKA